MGYFVFKKTNTGVKFDLVAGNHEVIATSEVYKSDASCKKGIASVRRNAPIANVEDKTVEPVVTARYPKFEIYLDKGGEDRSVSRPPTVRSLPYLKAIPQSTDA